MKSFYIRKVGIKNLKAKNTKHNDRVMWKRLAHKDERNVSKKIKVFEIALLN